jgi:16S rRNA (cytosine1402-N4)-methyltransferase
MKIHKMSIHKSVMLEEAIEALNLKNGDVVVDATLGGGGHSLEIIKKILPDGKLIAIDQDQETIEKFEKFLDKLKIKPKKESISLNHGNFSELKNILEKNGTSKVSAILADFGISSDQLEDTDRGFSFQKNARLDMRMNQEGKLSAWNVVNEYGEERLGEILREYGEEKFAYYIAKAITNARKKKSIDTTNELVEIIESSVPGSYRRKKIHCATKSFQAIRMEVNKERENLNIFLGHAIEVLNKKGRLAVITFHSGEDRVVKNIFRENARGCICPKEFPVCRCDNTPSVMVITKKPISPSAEEIAINSRSRSAKLRIVEKI